MSSSGASPGDFSPQTTTRLNATIGIAAFIVIFGCISFFIILDLCLRVLVRRYTGILPLGIAARQQEGTRTHANLLNKGLDEAVINSLLPVFIFGGGGDSNSRKEYKDKTECAVCLSEFEDGEKGRLLPKCNHAFHAECIDMWFQSHSTCPICRSAVVDNNDGGAAASNSATAAAAAATTNAGANPTSSSPIQIATSSAADEDAHQSQVVIIIPRLEDNEASSAAVAAADPSSSSPRRSGSFHTVIEISPGLGKEAEAPKSPVVTGTLERLRSLGRLWSRRDLANEQQLPSPRH